MGRSHFALKLVLGAGIVVLLFGLALLLYDSFIAYVTCIGESAPCILIFNDFFFDSILASGLALTAIGIVAIVFFRARKSILIAEKL